MNILVTGSKGFIGKNLIARLRGEKEHNIYECDKDTDILTLKDYCKKADFVYHLAGVNRTDNEQEFMDVNFGFTLELLDFLSKYNNKCPIMLSSSIQATYNNSYGKSKKAAEELVISYSNIGNTNVFIYRLPNVFGKWCKPDYNSVVATFCHNIARNIPIKIDDPEKVINLVYIDDVINELVGLLHYSSENKIYYEINPIYRVSLKELSQLLYSFYECNYNGYIPELTDDFTKKLYSTYLTYIPEDSICFKLKMNCDDRGSFTEFIKTRKHGQISVNVLKPGIIKGNHYHNTKTEKFLVVSGRGIIRLKNILSGITHEFSVSSETLEVINIPAGYSHNIENTGDTDMVVIIWCNEVFDRDNPDTYFHNVSKEQ